MRGVRRTREVRTCLECGTAFSPPPWEVDKGYGVTCSSLCRNRFNLRKANAQPRPTPTSTKPERVRAAGLVNMRIRRGAMERPPACTQCGKMGRVDAHHEDYAKPDQVEFLCRSCHMKRHRVRKAS